MLQMQQQCVPMKNIKIAEAFAATVNGYASNFDSHSNAANIMR